MALNYKNIKADTLGRVDAALTILERYPDLDSVSSYISANVPLPWSMTDEYNPFMYLLDLFKRTVGYEVFIKVIGAFLFTGLEALEVSIKGILLTNLKNLVGCSINPMITREMLQQGFVFDLRTLDLMGILNYSPLPLPEDNFGRYYYFGCDGRDDNGEYVCKFPDDIKTHSKDMNAWLWYIKNRSTQREVWKNKNEERTGLNEKDTKKDGILTLEYVEHSSSLTDAQGNGLSIQQIPHNSCLHVFLGNTTPIPEGEKQATIEGCDAAIKTAKGKINTVDGKINICDQKISKLKEEIEESQSIINNNIHSKADIKEEKEKLKSLKKSLEKAEEEKEDLLSERRGYEETLGQNLRLRYKTFGEIGQNSYKTVDLNYYYHRTIMEFNADYISHIKLFDPVTVAARLIDALTRCLSINLNITVEQQVIQHEIKKIIDRINSSDGREVEINDCFFTFTNTEYNDELNKAELRKLGVYVPERDTTTGSLANAKSLLSKLNGVSSGASQEKNQSVIEDCIMEIAADMARTEGFDGQTTDFKVSIGNPMDSMLDNLLNNLAYIITSSVLSPTIYLVLAINLKLLGEPSNPMLTKFIDENRNLIAECIRMIRDEIVRFLMSELIKALRRIASEIAIKMTMEQMEYYRRLLKRILEALRRFRRKNMDFTVDDIDYADIIDNTDDDHLQEVINSWC